ncbi:MAG: hypothetical protein FIB07_14420 [Candidatus Methanoperedens sp.]|nr:hypothetical protein [Candidatus Methanoperedens sp.]
MPPKRRKSRKSKKNNTIYYSIYIIFVLLFASVLISQSNGVEKYGFCEKMDQLNESKKNYPELSEQILKLCEKDLNKDEKELGNFSVQFLESLTFFSENWKENETIAKQYAKKIDNSHESINEIGINSSEIINQIESIYNSEINNLGYELEIQNVSISNTTYSVKQLKQNEENLNTTLERINNELEKKNNQEKNLSLIYKQKMNESKSFELDLISSTNEHQKIKNSFIDNLYPFLLLGIAFGCITGFVLSSKWKKEKIYWDAYSSSAKVRSPLVYAAVITVALLVILIIYLFFSGVFDIF